MKQDILHMKKTEQGWRNSPLVRANTVCLAFLTYFLKLFCNTSVGFEGKQLDNENNLVWKSKIHF